MTSKHLFRHFLVPALGAWQAGRKVLDGLQDRQAADGDTLSQLQAHVTDMEQLVVDLLELPRRRSPVASGAVD